MGRTDDYISREAVFELIDNAPIIAGNENESLISAPELSDKVYCLPATDVRPVVRGTWRTALLDHEEFGIRPKVLYCSECCQAIAYKTNFCPNCGADMRGDNNG